jgi:DNA mismatch endonuclease (patch repair protein)
MQANRRTDTKPERLLRSQLHRRGLRYRKDIRIELGGQHVRPDIVFAGAQVAVFVDGCFWHRCPAHATQPRANYDFWNEKLARNVARDLENNMALESAGWTVVRIWEHEDVGVATERVMGAVAAGRQCPCRGKASTELGPKRP